MISRRAFVAGSGAVLLAEQSRIRKTAWFIN